MDNNQLLEISIQAALEAGQAILSVYDTEFDVELKDDKSPLTLADKKSHDVIVSHLKDTGYPLLSEEGRDIPYAERKQWTKFWLIDPLDGTKEFVKRNGEFTVNIALVENGNPVLGVIYVPVSGELYFAAERVGAFKKENVDIAEPVEDMMEMAELIPMDWEGGEENLVTVVASRSHMSKETEAFIEELGKKYDKVEVMSRGSSLKLCMVAEGRAQYYPRYAPTMEWDTAAGQAICQVAGFQVLEYGKDTPLRYNKENLLNPWFIVK